MLVSTMPPQPLPPSSATANLAGSGGIPDGGRSVTTASLAVKFEAGVRPSAPLVNTHQTPLSMGSVIPARIAMPAVSPTTPASQTPLENSIEDCIRDRMPEIVEAAKARGISEAELRQALEAASRAAAEQLHPADRGGGTSRGGGTATASVLGKRPHGSAAEAAAGEPREQRPLPLPETTTLASVVNAAANPAPTANSAPAANPAPAAPHQRALPSPEAVQAGLASVGLQVMQFVKHNMDRVNVTAAAKTGKRGKR